MKKFYVIIIGLVVLLQFSGLCLALSAQDYFDKASLQYLVGDLSGALQSLGLALKINPHYTGALELRSIIRREMKLPPVAPRVDKNMLIKDYLAAGKKSFAQGNYAQAASEFSQVLTLDPLHGEALLLLNESLTGIDYQDKARLKFFYGTLATMSVGYLALAALLSFTAVAIKRRVWLAINGQPYGNYCFNCRARISHNIDLCPNCGAWIGSKMRVTISKEQHAWYARYGWHKNPFTLDIHPELFTGYRTEVKQVLEKLAAHSGHILITGPLGVGKTTLLRWLTNYLIRDCHSIYIPRPPQEFNQMIKLIAQSMGVPVKKSAHYDIYHLNELRQKIGRPLVVLIDEAHEFTVDIERPLRTLGDLDEVNLVMAGLPEAVDKLKTEIQPLYERLVLEISLRKLEVEDIKELIRARIENAGGEGTHPFTTQALEEIYALAKGNPRSTVKICDWAVTKAINLSEDKIGAELLAGLKTG